MAQHPFKISTIAESVKELMLKKGPRFQNLSTIQRANIHSLSLSQNNLLNEDSITINNYFGALLQARKAY